MLISVFLVKRKPFKLDTESKYIFERSGSPVTSGNKKRSKKI